MSALRSQLAMELDALSAITVALDGSAYQGVLTPRLAACIELPLEPPYDAELIGDHRAIVRVVIDRDPYVYAATETLHDAAAVTLPAAASMAAQTGEHPAPWDLLFTFGVQECKSVFAGRYPDEAATIHDFVHHAVTGIGSGDHEIAWDGGAATTDAAGYPSGAGNTVWGSTATITGLLDVTDYEHGEYLALGRHKRAAAGNSYAYIGTAAAVPMTDPVAITTAALDTYVLGVVTLPHDAVRGSARSYVRIVTTADGSHRVDTNWVTLIPASFGGLVGWRRASGHAHTLRWADDLVYADDVGVLGEAFGGRQILGKGGVLIATAELVTPAPAVSVDLTATGDPRYEQFPTSGTIPGPSM